MFRQLLTLLVVLFFVQTLVSANHHDSTNKVETQQAIHEEISDDVENFDVAEEEDEDEDEDDEDEDEDEDEEEDDQEPLEEEKGDEDEDFDEEFDEEFEENEDEEAAQEEEDFSEVEENYVDVINRNLASLEELKKALDPLPKKKEELIEGINRNLAKLAATITASNYPTLNPIPTAPSKSRTPSYQPGSTPSNTPTHQVAVTPSQTPTKRSFVSASSTRTRQNFASSISGTQVNTPSKSAVNVTVVGTLSNTNLIASKSNSASIIPSTSQHPCKQLSTKKCNTNPACYYSVLFNRCEHKGGASVITASRSLSNSVNTLLTKSRSSSFGAIASSTRSTRSTRIRKGCYSLKTQAACNSVTKCIWVASKNKCAHR